MPSSSSPSKSCPKYGSEKYWNDRYKGFQHDGSNNKSKDEASNPDPLHAWYFEYSDLQPLIIPLILGSEHQKQHGLIVSEEAQQQSDEEALENDTEEEETSDALGRKRKRGDAQAKKDDIIEEESDVSEEEPPDRPGLHGSVVVCEIGCGDVPLGTDLFEDLNTNDYGRLLEKIICTDYSSVCIDELKSRFSEPSDGRLVFQQADARNLPFKDGSFNLILEKGTLDAMLSDGKEGKGNCIKIVSECARILSSPGYLILISHLNANTAKGIDWLESIVFEGLQSASNKSSQWQIEVHGNEVEEVDDESDDSNGTAGPAVYIIQKTADETEAADRTIPVKFYSY